MASIYSGGRLRVTLLLRQRTRTLYIRIHAYLYCTINLKVKVIFHFVLLDKLVREIPVFVAHIFRVQVAVLYLSCS